MGRYDNGFGLRGGGSQAGFDAAKGNKVGAARAQAAQDYKNRVNAPAAYQAALGNKIGAARAQAAQAFRDSYYPDSKSSSSRSSGSQSGRSSNRSSGTIFIGHADPSNTTAQQRASARADAKLEFPWLPDELIDIYVDKLIESDNPVVALQEVRYGSGKRVYDRTFPGNRREDGTLRYSEAQYFSVTNTFRQTLSERGVSASVFEGKLADLIEGDVSPAEFESRVSAVEEGIVLNLPQVMEAFTQAWGVRATPESAFAAVLDPSLGDALLNREISVAQIRGEATRFGEARSIERGRTLAAAGVNQSQARDLYSQAGRETRSLTNAAVRYGDADQDFGIGELEDAALLSNVFQQQRLARLKAQDRSSFSRSTSVAGRQSGALQGLRDF